jgi:hypothetical protein
MRILFVAFFGRHSVSSEPDYDSFTLWEDIGLPVDLIPNAANELAHALIHERGLHPYRTANNRVVTALNETMFPNEFIRDRLIQQSALDEMNDRFTPQLERDTRQESTPFGKIALGRIIRQSISNVDFEALENPRWMIRYTHDCETVPFTPSIHPLLKDSFYGNEAHTANVGPRYLFVSPPAPLPWKRPRKLAFFLDNELYYSCFFAESTVRFAVIERTEMSLKTYIDSELGGRMDFGYAMQMGHTLINVIRALHARNIVHGDFSLERVRVDHLPQADTIRLSLTGFQFSSNTNRLGLAVQPIGKSVSSFWAIKYSPRELRRSPSYGYHDDVFRVVETIAGITQNMTQYRSMLFERLEHGTLLSWKSEGFVFGELDNVNATIRGEVRVRLEAILTMARRGDSMPPDYEGLMRLFGEIADLIVPRTTPELSSLPPAVAAPSALFTRESSTRPSRKRSRETPL